MNQQAIWFFNSIHFQFISFYVCSVVVDSLVEYFADNRLLY